QRRNAVIGAALDAGELRLRHGRGRGELGLRETAQLAEIAEGELPDLVRGAASDAHGGSVIQPRALDALPCPSGHPSLSCPSHGAAGAVRRSPASQLLHIASARRTESP